MLDSDIEKHGEDGELFVGAKIRIPRDLPHAVKKTANDDFDLFRRTEMARLETDNTPLYMLATRMFKLVFDNRDEPAAYTAMAGMLFASRTIHLAARQQSITEPIIPWTDLQQQGLKIADNNLDQEGAIDVQSFKDLFVHAEELVACVDGFTSDIAQEAAALVFLAYQDHIDLSAPLAE